MLNLSKFDQPKYMGGNVSHTRTHNQHLDIPRAIPSMIKYIKMLIEATENWQSHLQTVQEDCLPAKRGYASSFSPFRASSRSFNPKCAMQTILFPIPLPRLKSGSIQGDS